MQRMLRSSVFGQQSAWYRFARPACWAYPKRHFAIASSDAGLGTTMPPNFKARVGSLKTLRLPDRVTGSSADIALGKAMIDAWRTDGILQIAMNNADQEVTTNAFDASKKFFLKPHAEKTTCVDSQSYAGYIASGEEITDGIADYSEIFTVTKEHDVADQKVIQKWPCHGPNPWPSRDFQVPIQEYMSQLGSSGEKILQLVEYGLRLELGSLTRLTAEGWHHMRVLRFPAMNNTNGKGKAGRGIGSHTDYGLLVIAAQDEVGGLFIRPRYDGESFANWKSSTAGMNEDDERWVYVPPVPGVFTVFPGDMMQYLTNSYLPSTPHKVGLNTRERFAFAYFHEPKFEAVIRPLDRFRTEAVDDEGIHYGTHFTNMFMRNYPDRITTTRMKEEHRLDLLKNAPGIRVEV